MKKKVQLIALSILLVVVIVGGVWFLKWNSKEPAADLPNDPAASQSGAPNTPQPEPETPAASDGSVTRLTGYRTIRREEQDIADRHHPCMWNIFQYQGQFCTLDVARDERHEPVEEVRITTLVTNEVLKTFPKSQFLWPDFDDFILDDQGTAWAVRYQWENEESLFILLAPCREGVSEKDILTFHSERTGEEESREILKSDFPFADPPLYWYVQRLAIQDGRLYVCTVSGTAESNLEVFDLSTCDQLYRIDTIQEYCLDQEGRLYYTQRENGIHVYACSADNGRRLWQLSESYSLFKVYGYVCRLTGGQNGCYLWGTNQGRVGWLDAESQELQEIAILEIDAAEDMREPLGYAMFSWMPFLVDSAGRFYFIAFDFSADDPAQLKIVRCIYVLEPEYRSFTSGEVIVLKITSPYAVDSIEQAIHRYQRKYPEVEVIWDTQYASREAFKKDSMTYKEQISLRVMAGDVGDIVMVNGSGLDEDVITNTDAFADLSGYLDACDFRDELDFALLEVLRGDDGAIRAVPVALEPRFYVWNETLLEELGNPIDPDTVTWSELLKLIRQWKDEDAGWYLTCGYNRDMAKSLILSDLLLANLYDAEKADGTVQLDQPYLRELLERWKEVEDSPNLFCRDGNEEKALFWNTSKTGYFSDHFYQLRELTRNHSFQLRITGVPKGEVDKRHQGYAFSWAVSNASENRDAAWDLLQYLVSADGFPDDFYTEDTLVWNTAAQEDWLQRTLDRTGYSPEDAERVTEWFHQIQEVMKQPYSRLSEKTGWSEAVYTPVRQYLDDGLTLDQAMEQAGTNWARMLLE